MSNKIRISYSVPGCFIGGKDYIEYDNFEDVLDLDNYDDIKGININNAQIITVPELPKKLLCFGCSYNNGIELPSELPEKLIEFNCTSCNLTELPKLPKSLKVLWCSGNRLTRLNVSEKELPNLECLWCHLNFIKKLPKMSGKLNSLACERNMLIECPNLQDYPNLKEDKYSYNSQLIECYELDLE